MNLAIGLLPASAWQAAVDQGGAAQQDKHVAEITQLLSRVRARVLNPAWLVTASR